MEVQLAKQHLDAVMHNVSQVILGKTEQIKQVLCCWLAGGHILLEDVPGTGKTILSRAVAASVGCPTNRVQFTPDLLPGDIIGSSIYDKNKSEFHFVPGPIFTSVLLADEINRATPRTQSALLQAMAEGQRSVENKTYDLSSSFFVMATQNPIDQHGIFPLPEVQLDRFMMRLSLGYPDPQSELAIVRNQLLSHPIHNIKQVTTEENWSKIQSIVRHITVSECCLSYAHELVKLTRNHTNLALGASPRATIALIRCAQAMSLIEGFDFVKPDYVKQLSPAVLEHRVSLNTKARLDKVHRNVVISEIIESIRVPTK